MTENNDEQTVPEDPDTELGEEAPLEETDSPDTTDDEDRPVDNPAG